MRFGVMQAGQSRTQLARRTGSSEALCRVGARRDGFGRVSDLAARQGLLEAFWLGFSAPEWWRRLGGACFWAGGKKVHSVQSPWLFQVLCIGDHQSLQGVFRRLGFSIGISGKTSGLAWRRWVLIVERGRTGSRPHSLSPLEKM